MKKYILSLFVFSVAFALIVGAVIAGDSGQIHKAKVEFTPNQIIVKIKGDNQPFRVITLPEGVTIDRGIESFKKRGDVEYAEPDYIAHALMVPNDPSYRYQWHLDNASGSGVEAEQAWDVTSGAGAVIAVVDTGVAYEDYGKTYKKAPDLAQTIFVPGYDFVNNDAHPNDDNGHGTHVTGTLAQSTNNALGVAGLAYSASIMPVKVLSKTGSGTYSNVALGIRWAADNGAKVINMSLGGPADSQTLRDAVAYAYTKGVMIVAAAGNDGTAVLSYPAAYNDYVIAVGATRYDKALSYYSNYGSGLDIVAPGGDLTVDQNSDGYKDGVLQQTFSRSPKSFGYYFYQGTSMAAPHVSAAAALVLTTPISSAYDANLNGVWEPSEVQNKLQTTAKDLGGSGYDLLYGWGLVDAAAAVR